jgi:hypothetical protein
VSTLAIERALRDIAGTTRGASMAYDEMDQADVQALREASELARVLANILAGKSIYKAFGAPGDWGYQTPLGAALAAFYTAHPIHAGATIAAPAVPSILTSTCGCADCKAAAAT